MDIKDVKVGERHRCCGDATTGEQIVTVVKIMGHSWPPVSASHRGDNAPSPKVRPGERLVKVKPDCGEPFNVRVAELKPVSE